MAYHVHSHGHAHSHGHEEVLHAGGHNHCHGHESCVAMVMSTGVVMTRCCRLDVMSIVMVMRHADDLPCAPMSAAARPRSRGSAACPWSPVYPPDQAFFLHVLEEHRRQLATQSFAFMASLFSACQGLVFGDVQGHLGLHGGTLCMWPLTNTALR